MKGTKALAFFCCIMLVMHILTGCGNKEPKVVIGGNGLNLPPMTEEELKLEADQITRQGLYIYANTNESEQTMTFIKLAESHRAVEFEFYGGTCMYNRFGESMTNDKLKPGTIFTLELNETGSLIKNMRESDKVWTFENVENYSLDMPADCMVIGGENYFIEEMIPVFDGNDLLSRNQITDTDVLTLVGYGRTLLSVQISTAHGELSFKNTDKLEGGYFVLGNVAAAPIKKGASLSVRAGSFLLSVAGSGYAGSKKVTINPGEETKVDLSKLALTKNQSSEVSFVLIQENAKVLINGKEIDASKPLTLAYGVYRIEALLDGYDTWARTLFLNSPTATITISMTKNGTSVSGTSNGQSSQNNTDMAGTMAGSLAGQTDRNQNQNQGMTQSNENSTGENTIKETLINDVMNLITGNN